MPMLFEKNNSSIQETKERPFLVFLNDCLECFRTVLRIYKLLKNNPKGSQVQGCLE